MTLGYIFAFVGLGCLAGPILFNMFVPPRPRPLLWGNAAAFVLLGSGYLTMLFAPNVLVVLLSTFIRAAGSAVIWVYSRCVGGGVKVEVGASLH